MKYLFTSLFCLLAFCFGAIAQNNVTFQVDMNSVDPTTFTTPEVNGTFNGWCGNCAAMTDADGDGVWDITIDIANGAYEFKFAADNWGIQENLLAGSWCTVTNFGFTNRTLNVSGDTTLPVVCWNSCDGCSSGPSSYNVIFEVDMRGVTDPYTTPEVNGAFNGWCGSCWPMTDTDGDSVWQFSTIFAPGDSLEWKYSADNWNIQEDLDSALSCITINYDPGAPNGWGFVNRVAVVNNDTTFSSSWNNCVVTGVNGCTDSLAANYDSLATIDNGSCLYSTTFNVNMNCDTTSFAEVNLESPNFSWCGGCVVLLDPDGDGIHSITLDLPIGDFEYKYALDSWAHQEDLVDDMQNGGTCAPVTDYSSFANRLLSVLPASITNDSYGTCVDCVTGCTDSLACNFDPLATSDDGSCLTVFGCTDSLACNFDPLAGCDDGSCLAIYGCTDSLACNFDPLATCDDGNCLTIYGCMNPIALNYDPLANCPDSCIIPSSSSLVSACGDFDAGPTAWPYVLVATTVADGASSQGAQTFTMNVIDTASGANFRVVKTTANGNFFFGPAIAMTLGSNSITVPAVTFDRTVKFQFSSGDVEFDFLSLNGDTSDCVAIAGCTDSTALNFNTVASVDDSSCVYCYYGCMDILACNYDSLATCDDGSCLTVYGCTDILACNFDPQATCDDGSCLNNFGCTDSLACNFDPLANCDDGSCLTIYGCTDTLANNYDPLATCDDSTCVYGYSVTFQLDLRGVTNITYINPEVNGMFNGWCGNCAQLEDLNNDSIWEITILIDSGSYEYKYSVDNWAIEENLFSGDSCTVSSNGFTNRILHVHQDTILDPVCWESCEDCLSSSGPSSYNVTFRLDMSEYVGPPFTTPEVNGTFNNWCGSCWAMTDDNGDNVWDFTALLAAGDTVEYKFSADGWNIQEELDSTGNCITVAFDPGAPNGWGYVNRSLVVDSEVELDAVCWNSCSECQGQTGISENILNSVFVYPNPSSGLIKLNTPSEATRIDVYSVLGKLIYSKTNKTNTNEHTINIKENGLYYISVYVGKEIISKKITIQN